MSVALTEPQYRQITTSLRHLDEPSLIRLMMLVANQLRPDDEHGRLLGCKSLDIGVVVLPNWESVVEVSL